MDVPFISSGALSRAHYTLVRNVETATSSQSADQYLFAEINAIQRRLAQPGLDLRQCKECLIVLLYCSTTINTGFAGYQLEFAIPHAINLAEAGTTVKDKRIGYLFCSELMPAGHELQLMLVNTLRKHLESASEALICLALDTVIYSSSEDLIPAIQSRLFELISHNSPHIRRKTLMAFRALANHSADILTPILDKTTKRARDPDISVASAALVLIATILQRQLTSIHRYKDVVHDMLQGSLIVRMTQSRKWKMLRLFSVLRLIGVSSDKFRLIDDIIQRAAQSGSPGHALLYQACLIFSAPNTSLSDFLRSPDSTNPIHHFKHLLTADTPEEHYVFLSCLDCLDPRYWSGSSPTDAPSILQEWEVERMMTFVDSHDALIRKKTLTILARVDISIVESCFSRLLETAHSSMSIAMQDTRACRLLEIAEGLHSQDGEAYARRLQQVLNSTKGGSEASNIAILEGTVASVVTRLQNGNDVFRIGFATTFLVLSIEQRPTSLGSTWLVIFAAVACEYGSATSIPPSDILHAMYDALHVSTSSVQDALLLAMLAVASRCENVSEAIVTGVADISEISGRYIRRRCHQFTSLVGRLDLLKEIVSRASSSSLPDFRAALEAEPGSLSPSSPPPRTLSNLETRSNSRASPSHPLSASKLRYTAYDPPPPAKRIQRRQSSRSSTSSRSTSRTEQSMGGSRQSNMSLDDENADDPLARTVTAGDLALAAGDRDLKNIGKEYHTNSLPEVPIAMIPVTDLISRTDLISLDSPFITDPSDSQAELDPDFESAWNEFDGSDMRGWCDVPMEMVLRRLQQLHYRLSVTPVDQGPFEGELKVLVRPPLETTEPPRTLAAVRLKEGDDESCLWRVRCKELELRRSLRELLSAE